MDLLKYITIEDIDLLLSDIAFIEMGYEILYVIDPYDVFAYTFPYGIKFNLVDSKSPDDVGDLLIAYEYIFRNYNPIILDEYKLELILNRNLIKGNTDKRIQSNILSLTLDSDYYTNEDFSKSSTFLLATSLFQEQFINKFDNIYFNKLQIDSLSLKNKNVHEEKQILDLFKDIRKTDWSVKQFSDWVKSKGEFDYNDHEVIKEFQSTLRDFIAVDRIISINKAIQKNNELKNKYLILYYSGAKKSQVFFQNKELINHLPQIKNRSHYNLLRTPKHSFLLFLIQNSDFNKVKQMLEEFKEIAIKKHDITNRYGAINKEEKKFFETLNIRRRSLIEKTFIESQIEQHKYFKKEIQNLIDKLHTDHHEDLRQHYETLLSNAKKANEKTELIQTNSSYLLQGSIIHLIQKLKNNENFSIYKGMDLIKGSYHHLPILIFCEKNSSIPNQHLEELYINLVDYTISASHYRTNKLNNLVRTIKKTYNEIENVGSNKEYYYEILVKVFILIFVEKAENIKGEVAEIIEHGFEHLKFDKSSYSKWSSDYIYTLAWVLRRINDFEKCSQYCDMGKDKFPKDPRFYHGKALYLYNISMKKDSLESCTLDDLQKIILESEKAINLYKDLLSDVSRCRSKFIKFIYGSISAICNLLVYSISLFYLNKLNNNEELESVDIYNKYNLNYLRYSLLQEMKNIEIDNNNPTESWPEYIHTEAVLELVEAVHQKNTDKVTASSKSINLALKYNPNSELYEKTKEQIDKWKNRFEINTIRL